MLKSFRRLWSMARVDPWVGSGNWACALGPSCWLAKLLLGTFQHFSEELVFRFFSRSPINNTLEDIDGALVMAQSYCKSSPGSFDEPQTKPIVVHGLGWPMGWVGSRFFSFWLVALGPLYACLRRGLKQLSLCLRAGWLSCCRGTFKTFSWTACFCVTSLSFIRIMISKEHE